jgi:aminoglycoside 6'-N-acetyltransferase
MGRAYAFHPMTSGHLPMIRRWLTTPDVARWWGDPEEQYALVSDDLGHPDMDQFIVALDDQPFGYIQCYALDAWDQGFGPQPEGTRGIDQFIGAPKMIGRGHGSAFIRQFVDGLMASGIPRIVTDPDPANSRAVRAYAKAGFASDRMVETPDGPARLMVRTPVTCSLSNPDCQHS